MKDFFILVLILEFMVGVLPPTPLSSGLDNEIGIVVCYVFGIPPLLKGFLCQGGNWRQDV